MNGTSPAPGSDPNPVRTRARRRRRAELGLAWVALLALIAVVVLGGPWLVFVAALAVGAVVVSNSVALAVGHIPEEQALVPGALARAGVDRAPVRVVASWAPRRRAPDRERQEGRLSWDGGRLRFTVERPLARRRSARPPELVGVHLLDAEPWELHLGPPPRLWRPQLVLWRGDERHVLELCPGWDLAGVGVGVLLTAEWHRQLVEVGVAPR